MFPKDFPDSKIAKGFTFGRTKAVYALNSVFFFYLFILLKNIRFASCT